MQLAIKPVLFISKKFRKCKEQMRFGSRIHSIFESRYYRLNEKSPFGSA